jgi:hypothetical protein
MDSAPKRDLPWGLLALGITGLFLAALLERSLRHEPDPISDPIDVLRPRGIVDDLSPIEWSGGLPGEPFRFLAVVRDDRVDGGGELLRSDFLTTNSWTLPEGASDGWDRVRIRVFVVDPGKPADLLLKEPAMISEATVAWERDR